MFLGSSPKVLVMIVIRTKFKNDKILTNRTRQKVNIEANIDECSNFFN